MVHYSLQSKNQNLNQMAMDFNISSLYHYLLTFFEFNQLFYIKSRSQISHDFLNPYTDLLFSYYLILINLFSFLIRLNLYSCTSPSRGLISITFNILTYQQALLYLFLLILYASLLISQGLGFHLQFLPQSIII